MPCTCSLSRREGVCNAWPWRHTACTWLLLVPRNSGGGLGLHYPVWEDPKQGQQLTLGHTGNLKLENTGVYGAKQSVKTSHFGFSCWRSAQLPCLPGGTSPDWEINGLLVQRAREEADMSMPRSAGAPRAGTQCLYGLQSGKEESCAAWHQALQASCSLRPKLLHEGNAAARYTPHTCVPASTSHVRLLPEKKHRSQAQITSLLSPCKGISPTPWAARISAPQAQVNPSTLALEHAHAHKSTFLLQQPHM